MSSTISPPFPGDVPPTTLVPYSFIFEVGKPPSRPVIRCTISFVFLSIRILIIYVLSILMLLGKFNCYSGCFTHRFGYMQICVFEHSATLFLVCTGKTNYNRDICFYLSESLQKSFSHVITTGNTTKDINQNYFHILIVKQ